MASVSEGEAVATTQAQSSRARLDRLLATDRQAAGERRESKRAPVLATTDYVPTWTSRWHTFWREHHYLWRRACDWWSPRRVVALVLPVAAAGMAAFVAPWGESGPSPVSVAMSSEPLPAPPAVKEPEGRADVDLPQVAAARAAAVDGSPSAVAARAPEDAVGSTQDPKLAGWIAELSPRLRVVRADVLLNNHHPISDRRALGLLDSVVAAGVAGPHTHAARAEACLRLSDHACALEAIDAAIEVRPWRGGYRTLRRRIQRSAAQR